VTSLFFFRQIASTLLVLADHDGERDEVRVVLDDRTEAVRRREVGAILAQFQDDAATAR
jgi:hypothetical protein